MKLLRLSSRMFSLLALGCALVFAPDWLRAAPRLTDSQHREIARRGLDLLMNGDPDAAIAVFHEIRRDDPESPLGYLLEADAVWWKIYFSTANLIDPDVFVVPSSSATPYDAQFESLVHTAALMAEARIRANHDVARSYLYQGLAYGLEGRLFALRERSLPTARAGKKMRTALLKALELDPTLVDANLGVGTYNYFVDTLSAIVKLLRLLIGLPGGSRLEGLRQLQKAAEQGELARAEAKFYLAKNLSRRNERQYARSMELFQELEREYPENPFWSVMMGSLHLRLGRVPEGEALYRDAYHKTAGAKSETRQALLRAVRQAILRRHPEERLSN